MPGIEKPWSELTAAAIAALPAQLGVYEVADASGAVMSIGFAGGRETFGMRTALERELRAGRRQFRLEFTHGYLTRWQELLMLHHARHGALPPANRPDSGGDTDRPHLVPPTRLGTLSP